MNRPLLLAAFFASTSLSAAEGGHKLSLIPLASLSSEVPPRAGVKATGMLGTELKNAEGIVLLEAKRPGDKAKEAHQAGVEKARAKVEEAKAHRGKKKFRLAEEALTQALADYQANAAGVADIGELVDAHALLSAVRYNTGRDDEGLASLKTALGMAPARELPLAATSPLFSQLVQQTRKAVLAGPKGTLTVESTPPNGVVAVDGVALGATPLHVKDLPAGAHVWRVALATGEVVGGVVEVPAGKAVKVTAQSSAKDPEARILSALAQNKLDGELVAAAKEHAGQAKADLVMFGALTNDGGALALDAFLFAAPTGEVRRLSRARFDAELLSAGVEFFNLTTQVKDRGAKAGEAVKLPGAVAAALSPNKAVEVSFTKRATASMEPLAVEPAEGKEEAAPRAPASPKRAPLKKGR